MNSSNLKVGDSCEVVKVLTGGGYPKGTFKVGRDTVANLVYESDRGEESYITLYNSLLNGEVSIAGMSKLTMFRNELKFIGRLVVTKVK
ncbi:MAG TPA: hypothetical protein VK031_08900 [Tissierellaceae bacterium]|nr:hypothetical protein [Tissierellaceae bacterium]